MVDEKPPLTKEERRQRHKKLDQARRRRRIEDADVAPASAVPEAESDPPPAERRGRPKRRPLTAADLQGLKYFEKLAPLLERLHDVGCERDRAGNREFHFDDLCLLLLLALFNPVVDGLRGLQQASELESIQKRLGMGRVSLGALSEASRVFDASLLKPILEELGQQLQPLGRRGKCLQFHLQDRLIKPFGAVKVLDIYFKPCDRIDSHSFDSKIKVEVNGWGNDKVRAGKKIKETAKWLIGNNSEYD